MVRTSLTLLEQMKISDVDVSGRMEVLNLTTMDLELLASHQTLIEDNIDVIVEEFYENQTNNDEISLLIGDADTLRRLISAQRNYVLELFSGKYGLDYVNNRLRIGLIHKRIGVEPKLYLSAVRTLKSIVNKALKRSLKNQDEVDLALNALDKLIYFDTTLVFDAYIDSLVGEIENAKRKTDLYAAGLEKKVALRTRQLEEQAKTDPLTGIFNQRAMHDMLTRELTVAKRRQTKISLVYFDVDKFKQINDTLGHIEGDIVLKHIGQSLQEVIRETDIPCRYGGDEFCLILPECSAHRAEEVCQKLIESFSAKCPDISLSIGIAETGPESFIDNEELIKLADQRMYVAKQKDGFHICLKNPA